MTYFVIHLDVYISNIIRKLVYLSPYHTWICIFKLESIIGHGA